MLRWLGSVANRLKVRLHNKLNSKQRTGLILAFLGQQLCVCRTCFMTGNSYQTDIVWWGGGGGVGEWWTAGHETRILARPFPKGTVPPQNQHFNSHLKCLSTKLSEHWKLCSQWHTCNKCLVPTITVFKMRVWSQCINSGENIAVT